MSDSEQPGGGTQTGVDTSVLHLSPAERAERGVGSTRVREALLAVARHGDADEKDLRGVTLPELSFDRLQIDADDRHPMDLRGETVDGPSATDAHLTLPERPRPRPTGSAPRRGRPLACTPGRPRS